MYLVDSSVWIEDLRALLRITDFVPSEEVAVCPVIVQEVLQGVTSDTTWQKVRQALLAATMLENPVDLLVYEEAAQIYRIGRNAGFTIRKPNDCLVAAIAIRHAVPVLHTDRDFDIIARFTSLEARNVAA